jgi:uncharacterized protein YjbJ (UPF0337 family)
MNKDEMKGAGRQIKGKIKEEAGDLMDNRRMETEGKVEKNLGKAQQGVGRIERKVEESFGRDTEDDVAVMDEELDEDEELVDVGPSTRSRR